MFALYTVFGWRVVLVVVAVPVVAALIELFITRPEVLGRSVLQANLTGIAYIVTLGFTPERVPSTELYKATAQVLPVLLLAYIVDKRRDFHASDASERTAIFLVILYIVSAGYFTLDVLAYDDAARGRANAVIASMVATVVSLAISLLTPPRDDRTRQ